MKFKADLSPDYVDRIRCLKHRLHNKSQRKYFENEQEIKNQSQILLKAVNLIFFTFFNPQIGIDFISHPSALDSSRTAQTHGM